MWITCWSFSVDCWDTRGKLELSLSLLKLLHIAWRFTSYPCGVIPMLISATISTSSSGWCESPRGSGRMKSKRRTTSLSVASMPSTSERECSRSKHNHDLLMAIFRALKGERALTHSTPTMKNSLMYKMSYYR